MPKNVSNLRKFEHSVGKIVHPVDNNLRLTQRGMGAVLVRATAAHSPVPYLFYYSSISLATPLSP